MRQANLADYFYEVSETESDEHKPNSAILLWVLDKRWVVS